MEYFQVELPDKQEREYDIREYGAVAGGIQSNSEAIRRAIDAAYEDGGGKVVVPEGIWRSGPIELKSHIELHLEQGAVLVFSKSKEENTLYLSDFEGMPSIRAKSPIYADHASHVSITGKGIIDGGGDLWRPVKQGKLTKKEWEELMKKSQYTVQGGGGLIWMPSKTFYDGWMANAEGRLDSSDINGAEAYWDYFRPVMIRLYHCDHVLIEDITSQNSPAWNIHPFFCEHVTIRRVNVVNPYYAQNGDGLDVESCRYVEITDSRFDVGDDAICLKAGKGAIARKTKAPTEYVRIKNCTVLHGHGGFVVGSEMSRGVRHVEATDCTFLGTDVGIRFKSAYGRGGVVEDITLDRIQMLGIKKEAIIFSMGYILDKEKRQTVPETIVEEDIPYFRDITMRHITCLGAEIGLKAEGLLFEDRLKQHTIDNITLSDAMIVCGQDTELCNAGRITMEHVEFVRNGE